MGFSERAAGAAEVVGEGDALSGLALGVLLLSSSLSAEWKRGNSNPVCCVLANGQAVTLAGAEGTTLCRRVKCGGEQGTCLTGCWRTAAFRDWSWGLRWDWIHL